MNRFIAALILATASVTLGGGCKLLCEKCRSQSYRSDLPVDDLPAPVGTPVVSTTADRPY